MAYPAYQGHPVNQAIKDNLALLALKATPDYQDGQEILVYLDLLVRKASPVHPGPLVCLAQMVSQV